MEFILPASEYWLVAEDRLGHFGDSPQGVFQERYWIRALSEAIDGDDVRDQEVIRDVRGWLESPGPDADLIFKLTTLSRYSDVWEQLAELFFGDHEPILLLCEHVLQRIIREHRSAASCNSQGFVHTWRFAGHRLGGHPANAAWLRDRICEAASISIEMVNSLWHYYGTPDLYSVLRTEDQEPVRRHVLETMRSSITDGCSLVGRLSPRSSATLYQLVFDPGNRRERILADVQSWSWLGPFILEALRSRNGLVAANCGVLLGARVSGRERMTVDGEVLDRFFGEAASEVIDILDEMIDRLPETDQALVRNVIGAARQKLPGVEVSGRAGDGPNGG